MGTQEQMQAIYAKLHENRYEHVEQARRARDMQEKLAEVSEARIKELIQRLADDGWVWKP